MTTLDLHPRGREARSVPGSDLAAAVTAAVLVIVLGGLALQAPPSEADDAAWRGNSAGHVVSLR